MPDIDDIKATFKRYDLNGDGFVTLEELSKVLRTGGPWSDAELEAMFKSITKTEDDKIKFEEFVEWIWAADQDPPPPVQSKQLFNYRCVGVMDQDVLEFVSAQDGEDSAYAGGASEGGSAQCFQ